MWILGLKGLIGELHERERSPVAKKKNWLYIHPRKIGSHVTVCPPGHPSVKDCTEFPSLGQIELTNEKLSIEDKRFNGRT